MTQIGNNKGSVWCEQRDRVVENEAGTQSINVQVSWDLLLLFHGEGGP